MADPKKYQLQVTVGTSYDASTHQLVPVNTEAPIELSSDRIDARVNVRIQNYRGLPTGSPSTTAYFENVPHKSDLYSIAFDFRLKQSIPGNELVFGNDFEHAIKDHLPPGFSAALRVVKWTIDPGLDGDVYAEKPYLYGPLASSINQLWVGDKVEGERLPKQDEQKALQEGGSESGMKTREEKKVPGAGPARMKHFLTEAHRKDWTFEAGREYRCDFYNPYLDFNDLALKLPGNFKLQLMSFWDGQPLRYTLKHRTPDGSRDDVLFVVVFTLVPQDQVKDQEKKLVEEKKAPAIGSASGVGLGRPQRDFSGLPGGAGPGGSGAHDSGSGGREDAGVD